MPLGSSSYDSSRFTKITESRSTQTNMADISNDHLDCQCCDTHRIPRFKLAREYFQNPLTENPALFGDSKACLPRNTGATKSSPLASALQKKLIEQEERSQIQSPRGKLKSRVCSPRITGAIESYPFLSALQLKTSNSGDTESSPLPQSALQQKAIRQEERSQVQNSRGKLQSRVFSPRITGAEESNPLSSVLQLKTSRHDECSQLQNPQKECNFPCSDSRVRLPRNTGARESSPLSSARKQKSTSQEMQDLRREKPVLYGDSRVHLSCNTRTKELNPHYSPGLDDIPADDGASEMDLSFTGLSNRPRRHFDRPINQYAGQRKRHNIKSNPGREIHTSASTVWSTKY